ncbi:HNH endonuclease [Pelagibacterium luteolum]|uniref:HNH endonuclease n=1 Tax=Pelagibacterium luteolum TaxID=440168 RepID=A0A1G7Z8D7_9HYPH|nr:HNH endonuclease [Pelagibacterium luteolum]SDH04390.1 HNH endonuclease [Pelagibacterium luteolum]
MVNPTFVPIAIDLPEYQKLDGTKASAPFSKSTHDLFTRVSLSSPGNGDGPRTNYFKQQLVRIAEQINQPSVPYRFTDGRGQRRSMDGGCLKFVGPDGQGVVDFVEVDGFIVGVTIKPELFAAYANTSTEPTDVTQLLALEGITETERLRLVEARLGQGRFRDQVLAKWQGACAVTGVRLTRVIRASHIKPWREASHAERLDADNGLPLVATLDALFDAGLISFDDSGNMLKHADVLAEENVQLERGLRSRPNDRTAEYLRYHRQKFAL